MNEAERLLRKGMRFIPELIDAECGNSEGTPCDDCDHAYVCREHKWLKKVRALLTKERKP